MRKRKSPIVLITLLVVVVSGVVGFNFATSKTGNPAAAPPAPEMPDTKPVGEARPAQKTTDVSAALKGSMATSKPAAMPTGGAEGPSGPPGASGPIILNPHPASMKPEKPKPNSSSTSSQWYNDESALSKPKG